MSGDVGLSAGAVAQVGANEGGRSDARSAAAGSEHVETHGDGAGVRVVTSDDAKRNVDQGEGGTDGCGGRDTNERGALDTDERGASRANGGEEGGANDANEMGAKRPSDGDARDNRLGDSVAETDDAGQATNTHPAITDHSADSGAPTADLDSRVDTDIEALQAHRSADAAAPDVGRTAAVQQQPEHTSPLSEAHSSDPPSNARDSRKRARGTEEDRRRGQRMLGMLNSTLSQSREPKRQRSTGYERAVAPPPSTERRGSTAEDVQTERAAHDAERAAVRADVQNVQDLAQRLAAYELAYRAARASKRRLSSFLVTHQGRSAPLRDGRDAAETAAISAARISPHIPLVQYAGDGEHEVYYLPRKLLPAQEDALDEQEESVDAEIDRADDEWDKRRDMMQQELEQIKQRLQRHRVTY